MKKLLISLAYVAAPALLITACGGGNTCKDPANAPVYADIAGAADRVAAGSIVSKCTACHSTSKSGTAREGAPAASNYDRPNQLIAVAEIAADRVSTSGSLVMPPPSSGETLSAAEKELFTQWVYCGAKE